MKHTVRALLLVALLAISPAHAQDNDLLSEAFAFACQGQSSWIITQFGVDLRPLCQYASVVSRGRAMIDGLQSGALLSSESFMRSAFSTVAGNIGASIGTDAANEAIRDFGGALQQALGTGPAALSAYRAALEEALSALRAERATVSVNRMRDARTATIDRLENPGTLPPRLASETMPGVYVQETFNQINAVSAEQRLESDMLAEAATQILEQQLESTAYQDRAQDVLSIEGVPILNEDGVPIGVAQAGIAQQLERRAQSANSVRQAVNVLTEGVVELLRNDAVMTGAVIENLQAQSRQQAITNHQLQQLTQTLIREQEQEVANLSFELRKEMETYTRETRSALSSLAESLRAGARSVERAPGEYRGLCYYSPASCR
jgi:hypothetical protein